VCDPAFADECGESLRLCVLRGNALKAGSGIRAIVVNSGNANACTGITGIQHAEAMAKGAGGNNSACA